MAYRHGFSYTSFYTKWGSIIQRCCNKQNKKYSYYGGRGIKICEEWKDFVNFKNDMYESYLEHCKKFGKLNTSIDRKDNDGDYCKENCCWATAYEQAMNRRKRTLKLTDKEIENLKLLRKKGFKIRELAEMYNLSLSRTQALSV